MIRLNHCEPKIIGFETLYTKKDVMDSLSRQWGIEDIADEEIRSVSRSMIAAARAADFIGVPSLDYEPQTPNHLLERSVFTLGERLRIFSPHAKHVHVNIHYALGMLPEFFDMIRAAPRLILITCRDVAGRLRGRIGEREIVHFPIPIQHKFSRQQNTECHYPEAFQRTMKRIADEVGPSTLVLVGGGVLGKIYCHAVQQRGGVALDIGSLFDAWAGEHTRGKGFPPELLLS